MYGFVAYIGAYLLLIVVVIFVFCFMSKKMCEIAELKGYNAKEKHIFAICFWLTGFGILYVIALPDLKIRKLLGDTEETAYTNTNDENEKTMVKKQVETLENGDWKCPSCGAHNPVNDKRCYCGFKKLV